MDTEIWDMEWCTDDEIDSRMEWISGSRERNEDE